MSVLDDIISRFDMAQAEANKANEQRYSQMLDIADRKIKMYEVGGQFGQGVEKQIETAGKKSVASGMQSLVGAGLANTTQAAGLRKGFEEEVGIPARLQLEDLRMDRLSGALSEKAGILERRNDLGPSLDALMNSVSQISSVPSMGNYGGRDTFGASGFRTESDQASREAAWQSKQAADAAKYAAWQAEDVSPKTPTKLPTRSMTQTPQGTSLSMEELQELVRINDPKNQPKKGKWVAGWPD